MPDVSLLIGNGFNRLEDRDFPSWDSLIKTPVESDEDLKKGFVDIKNMSYPLKFEYIVNYINQKGKGSTDTYLDIKKQISGRLSRSINKNDKKIDRDISCLLKEIKPQNIITTNYDDLLEKVFISRTSKSGYSEHFQDVNKNKEIFLNRTRILGNDENKVNFYHIHGIDVIPQSICLGYEHYMRIVSRLRKRLIGEKELTGGKGDNEEMRIVRFLKNNQSLGNDFLNEYETKFFTTDMYIIGLGLTSEEVDLWWLLCFRAYLYFANVQGARPLINNKIVYLDIHPTKITDDGYSYEKDYEKQQEAMFGNMHIEYRSFEVKNENGNPDFKSKYIEALKSILK